MDLKEIDAGIPADTPTDAPSALISRIQVRSLGRTPSYTTVYGLGEFDITAPSMGEQNLGIVRVPAWAVVRDWLRGTNDKVSRKLIEELEQFGWSAEAIASANIPAGDLVDDALLSWLFNEDAQGVVDVTVAPNQATALAAMNYNKIVVYLHDGMMHIVMDPTIVSDRIIPQISRTTEALWMKKPVLFNFGMGEMKNTEGKWQMNRFPSKNAIQINSAGIGKDHLDRNLNKTFTMDDAPNQFSYPMLKGQAMISTMLYRVNKYWLEENFGTTNEDVSDDDILAGTCAMVATRYGYMDDQGAPRGPISLDTEGDLVARGLMSGPFRSSYADLDPAVMTRRGVKLFIARQVLLALSGKYAKPFVQEFAIRYSGGSSLEYKTSCFHAFNRATRPDVNLGGSQPQGVNWMPCNLRRDNAKGTPQFPALLVRKGINTYEDPRHPENWGSMSMGKIAYRNRELYQQNIKQETEDNPTAAGVPGFTNLDDPSMIHRNLVEVLEDGHVQRLSRRGREYWDIGLPRGVRRNSKPGIFQMMALEFTDRAQVMPGGNYGSFAPFMNRNGIIDPTDDENDDRITTIAARGTDYAETLVPRVDNAKDATYKYLTPELAKGAKIKAEEAGLVPPSLEGGTGAETLIDESADVVAPKIVPTSEVISESAAVAAADGGNSPSVAKAAKAAEVAEGNKKRENAAQAKRARKRIESTLGSLAIDKWDNDTILRAFEVGVIGPDAVNKKSKAYGKFNRIVTELNEAVKKPDEGNNADVIRRFKSRFGKWMDNSGQKDVSEVSWLDLPGVIMSDEARSVLMGGI